MGDESCIIKIGPVGNKNGNAWDENGHNNIVQIFVSHGEREINSIQFQYAENGSLVLSQRHGGNGGSKFDVVKLNHPTEYITWISGHTANIYNNLCSITFGTNHGEYGSFGGFTANDKEFCFKLGQDRQFYGFHGTNNYTVKSIGVYLKPNITLDFSLNNNAVKVKLNHPTEYINWISGHKSTNNIHLCLITFGTNHGDYGPFGRFAAHDKEFIFKLGDKLY